MWCARRSLLEQQQNPNIFNMATTAGKPLRSPGRQPLRPPGSTRRRQSLDGQAIKTPDATEAVGPWQAVTRILLGQT